MDEQGRAVGAPHEIRGVAGHDRVRRLRAVGRHELERVLSSDYSRAQIDVKLRSMSSDLVLELIDRADAQAAAAFKGTGVKATTTGAGRLFSTLDHYLVTSQINSFGTAFFTVFAVIFLIFRSVRFGFLTIAPNVLPVLAVLGVMGFLGISMNIATVMVASVALGVVDDDTIHFINRYRREVAAGATTDKAIEIATVHEGRGVRGPAVLRVQADGVVRRAAGFDDGGGVSGGSVHPSRDDQAAAGSLQRRRAAPRAYQTCSGLRRPTAFHEGHKDHDDHKGQI